MRLLDRWGEGVSQVIGVGGRDLSATVGGADGRGWPSRHSTPIRRPRSILLVVEAAGAGRGAVRWRRPPVPTPIVAALIGSAARARRCPGRQPRARRWKAACGHVVEAARRPPPRRTGGRGRREVARQSGRPRPGLAPLCGALLGWHALLRGAHAAASRCSGPVWSNTPLDARHHVPAPAGAHVCLDLGEEEYTQGRPHPMIDAEARLEMLARRRRRARRRGGHARRRPGLRRPRRPCAVLAPACAALTAPDGPASSSTCSAPTATPGPRPAAGRVPGSRLHRRADRRAGRAGRRRDRAASP